MATLRSQLPVAQVSRPPSGVRADLRAVRIVCHRELLRWGKDRRRLVAGLVQPLLWLFVLGTGLSRVVSVGAPGTPTGNVDFRTFVLGTGLSRELHGDPPRLLILAVLGLVTFAIAVHRFSKTD